MPEKAYYIYSVTANQILSAIQRRKNQIEISVDLNQSTQMFPLNESSILFDAENSLSIDQLQTIEKKENRVFKLQQGHLKILEYWSEGYYKLVPTSGAPTVEINGVKMHRSKEIDPFIDAKEKAQEVVKVNDCVLDTCSGLGYTAIWAVRLGASDVTTIEFNETMLKIRSDNPWSSEFFLPKIKLLEGDAGAIIKKLKSESFDSVLHDPPRLSMAGHLYGDEFYSELYRILKKNGRLFHYTGNPHRARHGNTFLLNVAKRLKTAGFRRVIPKEHLLGVKAVK